MVGKTMTSTAVLLCLLLASAATAQPQATIGPIPEMQKYPGLELWMVQERNIQFQPAGWWLGGYDSTMKVKWGQKEVLVKDLTESQKTYLWDLMSPEQRRQMSDEYGKIGFGMGGHLKQRPEEWGPMLNERIAEYFRGVSGWAEVAKRRHEAKIPPEVPAFMAEKDAFLKAHGDKLTPEQVKQVQEDAQSVDKLGALIATLELKKVEIAVKGLSAGLLGIITDYLTGFATHGANYVSDAIATAVSKMIDIGRGAADKSPSAGEQIQIINQQIAVGKTEMLAEMDRQRAQWRQMIGEEQPAGAPELSILFLVDTSGSMGGSKIAAARAAVKSSVDQTNDGKTEWCLVQFGNCKVGVICRFTMEPGKMKAAADLLGASGDTPLVYGREKALAYLTLRGRGQVGRLVILCDGQNNCPEHGGITQPEASAQLRKLMQEVQTMPLGGNP
ncbi:MAG: VWA domain-containing protein [Armatimonadetes bacterium]|nr:VWA domain-containing protein [Armatimonadota bacterium]